MKMRKVTKVDRKIYFIENQLLNFMNFIKKTI